MDPLLYQFIAGTNSGLGVVLVGHPFDTIKVRMQIDSKGATAKYTGPLDCLRKTLRNEGIGALYKGVRSPLTATPAIYALSFGGWGLGEYLLKTYLPSVVEPDPLGGPDRLTILGLFLIGGFSGALQSVVWAPSELVKKRLMAQDQARGAAARYTGMVDCARQVVRESGVRGLYVGFPFVVAGYIPAVGLWYGAYGYFRRLFNASSEKDPSALMTILAGGLAGWSAWGVMFPLDTLGARIQTAEKGAYKGSAALVGDLFRAEGVRGFYKGFVPCMLRAFPADGALFLVYELTMKGLRLVAG